jgi:2'-5' RNA ligase
MAQKYTIAHFFEPHETPFNFSGTDWPLHATLLDMFVLGRPVDELIRELENLAQTTAPFDVTAVESAHFGPNKNVAVTLLDKLSGIVQLHESLLDISLRVLAKFDHPEYVGEGFVPHATKQKAGRLEQGNKYRIDNISLVDMYPKNDITRREIIRTLPLKPHKL